MWPIRRLLQGTLRVSVQTNMRQRMICGLSQPWCCPVVYKRSPLHTTNTTARYEASWSGLSVRSGVSAVQRPLSTSASAAEEGGSEEVPEAYRYDPDFPSVFKKSSWQAIVNTRLMHEKLGKQLQNVEGMSSKDLAKLSKHMSHVAPGAELVDQLLDCRQEIVDLSEIIDANEDAEMVEMAKEEKKDLYDKINEIEKALLQYLIPVDDDDDRNAILEVRAGTGGVEAALFTRDMFAMYEKYAAKKGWRFEPLDISYSENDGLKEASALISGNGVFGTLKYESGAHRVQRIPATESKGRVHTSAMTVALMPEAEEIDINITPKDLKIDVYRAGGKGGQSVNTTDSAVRVTHIPTGIVVCMQDERSQHQNRSKAMQVLRSRLYNARKTEELNKRSDLKRSQMGSGERSDRIRTYNFPQSRVTDHRVNLSKFDIDKMMNGEFLDEIITALSQQEREAYLRDLNSDSENA